MTKFDQIAFNLFFNSISSFIIASLIVSICVMLFRVNNSRAKIFLLSLPFIKVLFEAIRGIPKGAFVYTYSDPWLLPELNHYFWVGAGFWGTGPQLNIAFSIKDLQGQEHNISAAEFVWAWLSRNIYRDFPTILLTGLSVISFYLVFRRVFAFIQFEIERRHDFKDVDEKSLSFVDLGWRKVIIYRSDFYHGTPFTGGIFHPYICFPSSTYFQMDHHEREAVLQHELAHVRRWDLVVTFLIQILGDVFWCIPGYRFLSSKIDQLREVLADSDAVKAGIMPELLSSALLKLKETKVVAHPPLVYSAFFRSRSLIKQRIGQLLKTTPEQRPSFLWSWPLTRTLILFWTAGSVFISTLGGNYAHEHIIYSESLLTLQTYLMNLFR